MGEERVLFWIVISLVGLFVIWLVCDWIAWR